MTGAHHHHEQSESKFYTYLQEGWLYLAPNLDVNYTDTLVPESDQLADAATSSSDEGFSPGTLDGEAAAQAYWRWHAHHGRRRLVGASPGYLKAGSGTNSSSNKEFRVSMNEDEEADNKSAAELPVKSVEGDWW